MGVVLLVFSFLLRLFRALLNAVDPYLCRINIHLVAKPPSSVEELLATIRAESGGSLPSLARNSQWRECLQLALDSIRTADDVTPFGRWILYRTLLLEINSLQCTETIAQKFPEIVVAPHADRNRPIIIFGLWRSGTTLLHRLLSLYPEVFCPTPSLFFLGGTSLSVVKKASSLVDLRRKINIASKRYAFGSEVFAKGFFSIPYSIHPIHVDAAEECVWGLNRYLFYETLPLIQGHDFINFASQYEELSDQAYRLYKRDLHVVQSIVFPNSKSRFVLKSPYHAPFVKIILRHFPNAFFVRMHRNPAEVVASLSSLLREHNATFSRVDLLKLGRSWQKTVCVTSKELVRQMPRMPEDTTDVQFEEFSRDPVSVCRKIAIRAGIEHTKAMDEKLSAYMNEDNAQRAKTGKHVFTLEEFGLDAAEIRRECKEYCEMFAV